MNELVQQAIDTLEFLSSESDVSKRFKEKTNGVISILQSSQDLSVEKALHELEELNGYEAPSYHRTQLWDVISLLESSKN